MPKTASKATVSVEDRIKAAAYSLWIEEGRPEGRAEAHWFMATKLVEAEAAKPKRKATAKKPSAGIKVATPRFKVVK